MCSIHTDKLIDEQGLQTPTADNQALLAEMARFQGSFSAVLSGLRGYVTTRNRTFTAVNMKRTAISTSWPGTVCGRNAIA